MHIWIKQRVFNELGAISSAVVLQGLRVLNRTSTVRVYILNSLNYLFPTKNTSLVFAWLIIIDSGLDDYISWTLRSRKYK
jgi:hypothetical protein